MSECIVGELGNKRWYLNGKLHREGGPAIEYTDGLTIWYLNGLIHRETGPAIEGIDDTRAWWYLNGEKINCASNEEFLKLVKLKAFW